MRPETHIGDQVPIVIVLVGVLVLAGGGGLVTWLRRAASSNRTINAPPGTLEAAFRGDVLSRYVITSGSLAVLEFFDWGVRLRGNLFSRWLVPTWEARYEELAIAELVSLPHSRIAVWLKLREEGGGIGFLRLPSNETLPMLEKHGVPVDRSIAQIRRAEDLYNRP
jgi:hypothetical protein